MKLSAEQEGAGPDLVLLHGWGMNAAVWEGLPPQLAAGRRATRIELPGHGASPFEPPQDSLAAWAAACVEVAPEPAAWLAWSLGGLVALAAALQSPERVQALVLLTATPRFIRAPDWPAAMAGETLEQFHERLSADVETTLDRFLALQVRGSDGARETLRTLRRERSRRPAPDPRALALGLDLLRDSDLRGRLAELTCPTLWIFGQRDALVPAAAAAAIADLMPDARSRVIPGAAHAPFLSHPRETANPILQFLEEARC